MYLPNCTITYDGNTYQAELVEKQLSDTQFPSHLAPNYTLITNVFIGDNHTFTDNKDRVFRVLKSIKTPYFYLYEVSLL